MPLQLNLPVTPVYELLIKDGDLIAGTHGRSIWILDDLSPIRSLARDGSLGSPSLIAPRHALRVMPGVDWSVAIPGYVNYYGGMGGGYDVAQTAEGESQPLLLDSGENPPFGAMMTYFLAEEPSEPITLAFSKESSKTQLRTYSSRLPDDPPIAKELRIPAQSGWNRFVWNLNHADPTKIVGEDAAAEETVAGPLVAPGAYTATLTVGKTAKSVSFEIVTPPEATADPADWLRRKRSVCESARKLTRRTGPSIACAIFETSWTLGSSYERPKSDGSTRAESAALSAKVRKIEETLAVPDFD